MVSEIVILPSCFSEKNISSELIQVFKDIYNYPIFVYENSNWINQIKTIDSNETVSDSLRKALQVFIKKIKHRIIINPSSQTDFSKIINWLQEIKKYENINCVFITFIIDILYGFVDPRIKIMYDTKKIKKDKQQEGKVTA